MEPEQFRQTFLQLKTEIQKVIVGYEALIEAVLTALVAGGHVLLEGVPGLGKTLLVKTLAQALELHYSRIQFTPDLMPADIIGTNVVMQDEAGLGGGMEEDGVAGAGVPHPVEEAFLRPGPPNPN